MTKVKYARATLRSCASRVLQLNGYTVRLKKGVGVEPGSRLLIKKDGAQPSVVAVRTTKDGKLSFSKDLNGGGWRTVCNVDYVLISAVARDGSGAVEVMFFRSDLLSERLDLAYQQQQRGQRDRIPDRLQIFLNLDAEFVDTSDEEGLASKALWREILPAKTIRQIVRAEAAALGGSKSDKQNDSPGRGSYDDFVVRICREYADRVGTDPNGITVFFARVSSS